MKILRLAPLALFVTPLLAADASPQSAVAQKIAADYPSLAALSAATLDLLAKK